MAQLILRSYFRPKHIKGVGLLQDAGVLENSPLTVALSELHAVYPSIDEPQFLVNLSSESTRSSEDTQDELHGISENNFIVRLVRAYMPQDILAILENNFIARLVRAYMSLPQDILDILENNFIARLVRAYESLIRGRQTFDVFRRLIRRSLVFDRYFRLELTFDGPEPKLDDVKAMPKIKDMVRADKDLSQVLDEISKCIIASLFYFELDSIPEQSNGEYSGSGCILCLRRRPDPALVALVDKLSRSSARFLVCGAEIPGSVGDPPFWDGDGNFRKRITFKVRGEFMISLKNARGREYPISGAPFSVEKLVAAQGLNAYFGTSDHKRKSELVEENCSRKKRRRICRMSH